MTVSLQYLTDLSRVRITITDLSDGVVQVQRSLNPNATEAVWQRGIVRGGRALTVSGGTAVLDDYEFIPDVQNYYRVVPVDPVDDPEVDSITPSLDGRVWLKSVTYPMLNHAVSVSDYSVVTRPSRDQVFPVAGRSAPVSVSDIRGLREWTIDLKTHSDQDERKLELALMAGGVLFIHVPTTTGNALLPGSMHAVAGEVTKVRVGGVSEVHIFRVPLVEVAPPAPDVVGTTLTWRTVDRLFGSWTALNAAHPDWASLLATVGDPDDLVVI